MDVKTAFLNGFREEDIYMDHPKGFASGSNIHKVCKLKRSIYELKQASRSWTTFLTKLSKDLTLSKTKMNHVFTRRLVGVKSLFLSYMWMTFYS